MSEITFIENDSIAATASYPEGHSNPLIAQLLAEIAELKADNRYLHARLDNHDSRIRASADEQAVISAKLDKYNKTPSVLGTLPPLAEIERMNLQVFHQPRMTKAQRDAGFTVWTINLEYWHRGHKYDANIPLFEPKRTAKEMIRLNALDGLIKAVSSLSDPVLAGMVRHKTQGAGTPYNSRQIGILQGHEFGVLDEICAYIWIDDECAEFNAFTASKGTNPKRPRFRCSWFPTKSAAK